MYKQFRTKNVYGHSSLWYRQKTEKNKDMSLFGRARCKISHKIPKDSIAPEIITWYFYLFFILCFRKYLTFEAFITIKYNGLLITINKSSCCLNSKLLQVLTVQFSLLRFHFIQVSSTGSTRTSTGMSADDDFMNWILHSSHYPGRQENFRKING